MLRVVMIFLLLVGAPNFSMAQSSCEEGRAMLRPLWAQEKTFQKKQKCKDDNPFCMAGYPDDKLTDTERLQRKSVSDEIFRILRFGQQNNCQFIKSMK